MSVPTLDANRFRREALLVCNVASDPPTFFASFRLVLDRNIESDASSWFIFDPATLLPTGHVDFRSIPADDQARFLEHEATADDVGRFVTLGRDRPYVGILADLTGGKPETSARYREFLQPNGFVHELRVAFVRDGVCWGGVAIYRREEGPPFNNPEYKALAGVVEFLGEAMQRALLTASLNREDDGSRAPGVVVLGPANRVDLISPPAQEWLTGLGVELGDAWSTVLPGEVYAIASHARRTGAGHFDAGPAVSQAATAAGDKVDLHAALMESEPQGPVAVIVEPSRRPAVAAPVLAAYGLSAEEGEVLRAMLLGSPTTGDGGDGEGGDGDARVASVLAKVGVARHDELVAKVYADHYAPRLEERQAVGPEGWFEGAASAPESGSASE
ncbi:MAG: hypothetical protein QOI99_2048 [Actinomycetota bacterium]|nr:hypothetical protein [Actinomycetota bacterium]